MKRSPANTSFGRTQPAMAMSAARFDDVPLSILAKHVRLSPFQLHRMFLATAGETPKQFGLRLRLSRAAALLLTERQAVLNIALSCGFRSHEVFTRAFRRRFGMTPRAYRARGFATPINAREAKSHRAIVRQVAPCISLFHMQQPSPGNDMSYDIVKKDLTAQPVLVVRRRVKRSEIAATIGAVLPGIFQYAQQRGLALSGHPFTRYLESGPGMVTMEPGMRITGGSGALSLAGAVGAVADDGVVEDALPGGSVASTIHVGTYETLPQAYAALEIWMDSQGLRSAGAPWEAYITDPAEHPDPKDWRTEVCWPVK
jgi:AraC-like DNA-binding protein/effector-binding domain-containing protein